MTHSFAWLIAALTLLMQRTGPLTSVRWRWNYVRGVRWNTHTLGYTFSLTEATFLCSEVDTGVGSGSKVPANGQGES